MKKISIISLVLFLVIGIGMASAQIWTHNAPANYRVDVTKDQWSPGFSAVINPNWLFNGQRVEAGQEFELEMTFKSNRAIPSSEENAALQIIITDGDQSVDWWKELADYYYYQEPIPANTDVTIKIRFVAKATATNASTLSNRINVSSVAMDRATRLTFSKFEFKRVK